MKVVYHNHPSLGPESAWAAEAALCAADQGRFWDYYDKLFSSWAGENQGAFSKTNLKRFASELGLKADTFNSCLDTDKYLQQLQDEVGEANKKGIRATPTFFIGDTKIEGALPFDRFKAALDAALR